MNADVVLKQVASHSSFTTTFLTASALTGAKEISIQEKPAEGDLLEIDTGLTAELRTVTSVSGAGPYQAGFALALALPHSQGAAVTKVVTLTANQGPKRTGDAGFRTLRPAPG